MRTLRENLIIFAVLGVLAVIGLFMNSDRTTAHAAATSAPVTVVNTAANPVPVTGSTSVSGTIAATQSGTWNVGIAGNAAGNPLFVRDVNIADRQPFQAMLSSNSTFYFTVDATRRLTIEFVSAICDPSSPNADTLYQILTRIGTVEGAHNFYAKFVSAGVSSDYLYVGSDMTRFYADPGTNVVLTATPCTVTLSGYTEPN